MIPFAVKWVESEEESIIENGIPLTERQYEIAEQIGIINIDNIRLESVNKIPLPENQKLRQVAMSLNLITPDTWGLTLRYGIYIRNDMWSELRVVVHELFHTWQYEKLGGIEQFLIKYLGEVNEHGYPEAPMEQEAIRFSESV